MIRRPPRSTLFPSRRSSDLFSRPSKAIAPNRATSRHSRARSVCGRSRRRSEEHTSELQSHSDLVCRLLLEKKKKKKNTKNNKNRNNHHDDNDSNCSTVLI